MKIFPLLTVLLSTVMSMQASASPEVYFRVGPSSIQGAPENPGSVSFVSELDGSALSWPVGQRGSVLIGRYEGAASGWSCSGLSDQPWLACRFSSGSAFLEGVPPSSGRRSTNLTIANGASSFPLDVTIESDVVAQSSFIVASRPVIVDGSAGVPIDVPLGSRVGGSSWSCGGVPGLAWAHCVFDEGGPVRLAGTPWSDVSGPYFVPVYDAGILIENVEANASIVAGNDSVAMTGYRDHRLVTRGQDFVLRLADYSGGADGWSCRPASGNLPSWLRCDLAEGKVNLAGSSPTNAQSRESFGASYRIERNGRQIASSPYFSVYAVDRVVTGGEEVTLAPRAGAFTPRRVPSIAVDPSGRVNLDLGAFTGGPEGISCASLVSVALYPGMECRIVDGRVRLVGSVPASGSRYLSVAVAKDGIVREVTNLFDIHVVSRTVTGGEEAPDTPRAATYSPVRMLDRVYLPSAVLDQDLGAFEGGPEGVSCFSSTHMTMHPGTACHVVDGRVRVKGPLPSSGNRQLNFEVVKDGVVLGRSGLHQIDIAHRIVTGGPETPVTPRSGRFVPATQANVRGEQGVSFDLDLGAFEGGPEGVGCYSSFGAIHAGLACHVVDGRVRLQGVPTSTGLQQGSVRVAKDSVQLGGTGWFTITIDRSTSAPPTQSGGTGPN